MDTETTSKDPLKARVIGVSCCLEDSTKFYEPDVEKFKRWMVELRGRDLVFLNAKYDVHCLLNSGINLEELGCRVHDVAFPAALLDERRQRFNLNQLLLDFLGRHKSDDIRKEERGHISEMPAGAVCPYAEQDAVDVRDLDLFFQAKIKAEELEQVLDLEDSIIYAVVEMERNGALIDRPKLERWVREVQTRVSSLSIELSQRVKFKVNPNSGDDMVRLFKYHGLSYPSTSKGGASFEADFLEKVKNDDVQLALKVRRLDSLLSKYLVKYLKALDSKNILRYSLHQLRSTEENYGTISGRFSMAAPSQRAGANLQQVMRVKDQLKMVGPDWIIRELFIPEPGKVFVAADAAQIEFRLFAHYAKSEKLLQAYRDNPRVDFHDKVRDLIRMVIPDFDRQPAKTMNFTKVYGGGRAKVASELGLPRKKADVFVDAYDQEFPEVQVLLDQATRLANERGYVKTYLGRRARFVKPSSKDPKIRQIEEIQYKPHSALNRVLQGTAGDVMKKKIKEVYDNRKDLQLTARYPVHDELDGDQPPDPAYASRFEELLNEQSTKFRVPILWEVGSGRNWAEAKEKDYEALKRKYE
jgi:DNA polymerase-1